MSQFCFSVFILVSFDILPEASVSEALQHLADQITNMEQNIQTPCSLFLGTLTEQTSAMNSQNIDSTLSVPPGI